MLRDEAFPFWHVGPASTWREGPVVGWSSIAAPLGLERPADAPVVCATSGVPCSGPVDLSRDAHAVLCVSVSHGNVLVSGVLRYPAWCLSRVVNGSVVIRDNDAVTSLSGFGKLERIGGDLVLERNRNLVSLSGLDALTRVSGRLVVSYNGGALSLTALDDLVLAERRAQQGASADATVLYPPADGALHMPRRARAQVEGGGAAQSLNRGSSTLLLEDTLAGLQGLQGLGALQSVDGDFELVGNPELLSLDGLSALITIGGSWTVGLNNKLASFAGAAALASVGGGVRVVGNAALATLDGVTGLQTVAGELLVSRNPVLQQLGHLPALASVGGNLTLWRNEQLVRPSIGGTSRFVALAQLGGSLVVEDNPRLSALTGLGRLTAVAHAVYVVRNPKLATLANGLGALAAVGGDVLVQARVASFQGLEALQSVGGSLVVHALPLLTSLRGLGTLRSVGANLVVQGNPMLASVSHLSSLAAVGGRIEVYNNPRLADAVGLLDALHTVGALLRVDFANGTVDCPRGTGVKLGHMPLIYDTTAPLDSYSATTAFGNWCTFNCRYPFIVSSPQPRNARMWQCREHDAWGASWAPSCLPP